MKRGWIFWDRDELPEAEFDRRTANVRSAMRAEQLDAIVVYGDALQSGNLSYLTHFFPYADTGALILPFDAPPRLVTTHAYRNMPWFNTITWIKDIVCTGMIGPACADFLASIGAPIRKIGMVSGLSLPSAVAEAIQHKIGCEVSDFSAVYEGLRIIKSDRELAFVRKAADIADRSFKDLEAASRPEMSGFEVAAELELAVRRRGAEDLYCFIQPEGSQVGLTRPDARRIRGFFSVEIAVEFNGYWAKLGRSIFLDRALRAKGSIVELYAGMCRQFLEEELVSRSARPFLDRLRSRLLGDERLTSVRLHADFGLEPYWAPHLLTSAGASQRLEGPLSFYLQARMDLEGRLSLLRTDTYMVRDSRLFLLTPS